MGEGEGIDTESLQPPLEPLSVLAHLRKSANGTYRIAVVGNGPLFEDDRQRIGAHENVLRFNDLKNWREGERVTLHACRADSWQDGWIRKTAKTRAQNVTRWALAYELRWVHAVRNDAQLVSWTFKSEIARSGIWQLFSPYRPQVLEPWRKSARIFSNCSACGAHCVLEQTDHGPSAGAITLSALQAIPEVAEIAVFGMNWFGGDGHNDFLWPQMVPTCCTKCKIHLTPTQSYLTPRFAALEKAEKKASAMRATVFVAVSAASVVFLSVVGLVVCTLLRHRRARHAANGPTKTDATAEGRSPSTMPFLPCHHERSMFRTQ
jgi:hypothetical protein